MQDQGIADWPDAHSMVNDASKHDANGAKFNDWRLPTKDELSLMYWQRVTIGGFTTKYYWSSTEFGGGNLWLQDFDNGAHSFPSEETTFYVRAVRAF